MVRKIIRRKPTVEGTPPVVEEIALPLSEIRKPWEMTKKEWDAEWAKTRIDYTGSQGGPRTNIGKSVKGADQAFQDLVNRMKWLQTGLPDVVVEGMQRGARHYRVVENALAEGKPVPAEVLANYPNLDNVCR